MNTPSTSRVTSTVASAANDGAGLRRTARIASRRKNPTRIALRPRAVGVEGARSRLARSRVDLVAGVAAGRLVAHELALIELQHAAAHLVDHRLVVGGDEHRGAGAVDPVEQPHDVDRGLGIEVAGRLVGEQQRRVVDERPRDRDALLLPAGELVGHVVQLRRQAGQPQDVRHLGADLLAGAARHLQRVGDVVVHGAVRQQLEVLEDDADVAPEVRDPAARDLRQVVAGDADRAVGRIELLDQQAHERRLARAGRADEEDELAAVDRERHPIEAHIPLVELGDPAELDHRAGGDRTRIGRRDRSRRGRRAPSAVMTASRRSAWSAVSVVLRQP